MSSDLQADLRQFLFLVPYVAKSKRGVPVDELCERLGITHDRLHNLLDRVVAVGPPDGTPDEMVEIYVERERVHVALPQEFVRPPRFGLEEALSLLMALGPLRNSPLPDLALQARELSDLLLGLTSERASDSAADLHGRLSVEPEQREDASHLRDLEIAVRERRVVEMEYYTAWRDALTSRELRPLGLIQSRGAWYVIGNDGRTFKVERIRTMALTDRPFEAPAGFSLEEYQARRWDRNDDQQEWMKFREGEKEYSYPSSPRYAGQWVRTQRGRVELVEPSTTRASIVEETRELLARYRN